MTDQAGFQIRTYQLSDETRLVELWRACELTHPANDPNRDIALKLAHWPEGLLVAERDNAIVGSVMVGYEGHRGWINYLAVHPDFRLGGIGWALMEQAELLLRGLGCPKINLQVRKHNTGVIAFYERIGFSEDAVIPMGKRLT